MPKEGELIERSNDPERPFPFMDQAAELTVIGIDDSFGVDVLEISPDSETQKLKKDFVDAVGFKNDMSEEGDEGSVFPPIPERFDLLFMDRDEVKATLAKLISSAMSSAYLLGRLDQLHDSLGTNAKRAVRTKEIPKVIDQATVLNPRLVEHGQSIILDILSRYRGVLKEGEEKSS
jgi:hypothetical protein